MPPLPAIRSFSEIRTQLDPCCNYVVFEEDGGGSAAEEFQTAFDRLPLDAEDVLDRQFYREAQSGLLLLVARLAAGRGERIRERILSQGIPLNTALFYYGSSPDGGGHEIQRL